MADPLALYTSVMGRLWEDERIRGQAAARIDARLAGRRQGRSFARVGSLSARNALKAASGQSRAAVFKRIRAGGCKTRASLGAQISYINDKAVYTYSTMTNALTDAAVLTEEQKKDIVEDWAGTWRGSTKLGFTSHMLLSFPTDVTVDQVRDIGTRLVEVTGGEPLVHPNALYPGRAARGRRSHDARRDLRSVRRGSARPPGPQDHGSQVPRIRGVAPQPLDEPRSPRVRR